MSEPLGGVKHGTVATGELLPVPPAEGRRIRAQVDNNVVDGTSGAADQFGFLVGLCLVVHAANRTPLKTERGVELQHVGIQAMLDELFAAPGTREITPLILHLFQPDQEGSFKCCFDEFHGWILHTDAFVALHTSTFKGTSYINKHRSGMAAPQKCRNLTELRPRSDHNKGIDVEQCL
jgi:hypothetical protein